MALSTAPGKALEANCLAACPEGQLILPLQGQTRWLSFRQGNLMQKIICSRKRLRVFVFSAVRYFLLSDETSLAGDAEAVEAASDAAKSPLQCILSGSGWCEPFMHLPEPLPACSRVPSVASSSQGGLAFTPRGWEPSRHRSTRIPSSEPDEKHPMPPVHHEHHAAPEMNSTLMATPACTASTASSSLQ